MVVVGSISLNQRTFVKTPRTKVALRSLIPREETLRIKDLRENDSAE